MNKERKATREDVARLAGVSKTTVTYVINDTDGTRISPDTRQRVLDAARKLKYQADFSATCLVRGKTNILGLLVPMHEPFTDYYSKILYGLQMAAGNSDYHFLYLAQNQPEKYQRSFTQGYLEGVFVLQSLPDERHLNNVLDSGLPAVAINYISALPLPHVSMDYEKNVTNAVAAMVDAGRKDIGFICGAWENQPNTRYRDTFNRLATEYGARAHLTDIPVDKRVLQAGLLKNISLKNYDGVIIEGYEFGLQIEDYLQHQGILIGRQLDITVFSDSYVYRPFDPRIKVLQAAPEQVGSAAWEHMTAMLDGADMKQAKTLIPFEPDKRT